MSFKNRFALLKHKYFHLKYNNLKNNSVNINVNLYDLNTLYKRCLMK